VKIGFLGYKGSGKSTLFRALARSHGPAPGDPGRSQVAAIPDEEDPNFRLLCGTWQPKKATPLGMELTDYAGISPAGDQDEGFKLNNVSVEITGLVLVVRGFPCDQYFYPRPAPDPVADARDLVADLVLADLEKALRREGKLEVTVKKPTPRQDQDRRELALIRRVRAHLEAGQAVKTLGLLPEEMTVLRGFGFLTAKPWFLLVSLPDDGEAPAEIPGGFEGRGDVRARLEGELLDLPEEERSEFARDMGLSEFLIPGLPGRIGEAFGMVRFYVGSEKEVRAFEVEKGANVATAAGRIHTDFERGFIRAEVTTCESLASAGDPRGAKAEKGWRVEGREYRVKDGDVLNIRFSI
jgi:ribosome-binding ATPase YchF (GTP1/OBG family)